MPARIILCLLLTLCGGCDKTERAQDACLVGVFSCDATPPVGHPLCGGWIAPVKSVDDPLFIKGVVLSQHGKRYVLCALDWCRVQGEAYDRLRRKIAEAANTPVGQVSVHTVHQHDAPLVDYNAQILLDKSPETLPHLDLAFFDKLTERVAEAVKAACKEMQSATHIGYGKAQVEDFASNRRVKMPDGSIFTRSSSTTAAIAKDAPVGVIDPWLRTVTFFNADKPLVRLHYYASHPQTFYGKGEVSADTAGLARARLEKEEHVPHIYFTGCGGDITAGKYNTGTPPDRVKLTERLYAGMQAAIAATERAPLTELRWTSTSVKFPPRTEPAFNAARLQTALADTTQKPVVRIKAALFLAWSERLQKRAEVDLSALRIGPVVLVHLPGESFIEYQLHAQQVLPGDFVAVASYGECGPGYICTDAALTEGGYEPTMSLTGSGTEAAYKAAIAKLLGK